MNNKSRKLSILLNISQILNINNEMLLIGEIAKKEPIYLRIFLYKWRNNSIMRFYR
jgi:hypothetical protein